MSYLVIIGSVFAFLGIAGLLGCAWVAWQAKQAEHDEAAIRQRLRRLFAWHAGSLALAALGLMIVIVGLILR